MRNCRRARFHDVESKLYWSRTTFCGAFCVQRDYRVPCGTSLHWGNAMGLSCFELLHTLNSTPVLFLLKIFPSIQDILCSFPAMLTWKVSVGLLQECLEETIDCRHCNVSEICGSSPLFNSDIVTQLRRMRWQRHMIHKEEMRNSYKIFTCKSSTVCRYRKA
jgi:hypothetical protein